MSRIRIRELPELPGPTEADFAAAHRRLLERFEPVHTSCGFVDGPFGRVLLARTSRGLCRVSFLPSADEFLNQLEGRGLMPEMAPAAVDRERRQLDEYFEGRRRRFDLAVDLCWGTAFQKQVLDAARDIPFGRCVRYAEVAGRIGRPRACRAVGNALGANPVAIVIPCHRVVAAGGKLGGYTGGLHIKRALMRIEGIRLEEN